MRPNTTVPDRFLMPKMIYFCGEDPREVEDALGKTGLPVLSVHSYRCYRFWSMGDFGVIWSGIGSGCVEPLMWEILEEGTPIRELILLGTAGLVEADPMQCGKVYAVEEAYACATGIAPEELPARPNWPDLPRRLPRRYMFMPSARVTRVPGLPFQPYVDLVALERKVSLSTDWYYGFSKADNARVARLQKLDARLRSSIELYWRKGRLLEMEVAQFYFLCRALGPQGLKYLALKGVSNLDGKHETQVVLSQQILSQTLAFAFELLDI